MCEGVGVELAILGGLREKISKEDCWAPRGSWMGRGDKSMRQTCTSPTTLVPTV